MRLGAAAALIAVLAAGAVAAQPAGGVVVEDTIYQDDVEAREALVSEPLALLRQGRTEAAIQAFERQYARAEAAGASAVERAELLTAFALTLHEELVFTSDSALDADRASIKTLPFLRRVIEISREAHGDLSDESAYAWADYGVVALDSGDPTLLDEAEAAFAEAYRIRLAIDGPDSPMTSAMLAWLGETRGDPRLTLGDPDRIAAASALFEQATQARPYVDAFQVYVEWGRMFARNGRPDDACRIVSRALADAGRMGLEPRVVADGVADALDEAGHAADAEAIGRAASGRPGEVHGGVDAACLTAADDLRRSR